MVYPLDTAKVRLQTQPGQYRNFWHVLSSMLHTGGIASWYRGLLSPVIGYGVVNATAFGTYAHAKDYMLRRRAEQGLPASGYTDLSAFELFQGAAFAGFVQAFARTPVERVKTIMQAQQRAGAVSPYRSSLHCLADLTRKHGFFRGPMGGTFSTICREVPQYAVRVTRRAAAPRAARRGPSCR